MEYLSRTYPSTEEHIAPSSLLPTRFHHPHLVELQKIPVNWDAVDYCVEYIVAFLAPYRRDKETHRLRTSFFVYVVCNVFSKSQLDMGTLLVALSFINRTRRGFASHLHANMEKAWDCEDLFMAALITANKALNDSCYPLSWWATWSSALDKGLLRTAERRFLTIIEYDVSVKEVELLSHYDGVMEYCARKKGGWCKLMNLLPLDSRQQEVTSPKVYPAPIGAGRSHADPQQLASSRPVASSSALSYNASQQVEGCRSQHSQAYTLASASHQFPRLGAYQLPTPQTIAPPPPLPVPPTPWHSAPHSSLPVYDRRDRARSRSPLPRRPHAPPTPAHADSSRSLTRLPPISPAHPYRERCDRHLRDRRVHHPREHVLDHNHEPHPWRANAHSSRPYDADRYRHHRSPQRNSPGGRLLHWRDLWNVRDFGPDHHHGPPPPPSGGRYDSYLRSRPVHWPPRPQIYGYGDWSRGDGLPALAR